MRIFSHPIDRRWSATLLVPGLAALMLFSLTQHRAPLPPASAAAVEGSGSTAAPAPAHRAERPVMPAVELSAAARQQLLRAIVLSGPARPYGFFR